MTETDILSSYGRRWNWQPFSILQNNLHISVLPQCFTLVLKSALYHEQLKKSCVGILFTLGLNSEKKKPTLRVQAFKLKALLYENKAMYKVTQFKEVESKHYLLVNAFRFSSEKKEFSCHNKESLVQADFLKHVINYIPGNRTTTAIRSTMYVRKQV